MAAERIPNREQQAVIDELDRNIVLFASAGTGKTFTVARRVDNILRSGRTLPERILCLTFTIKAANEMKEDILGYAGDAARNVNTRTIHSFAYQVLREESARNPGVYCIPGVCDDADEAEELKLALIACGLDEDAAIFRSQTALNNFSSVLKHRRELLDLYSDDEVRDFQSIYARIRDGEPQLYSNMTTFYDPVERLETSDYYFLQLMNTSAGAFMHRYNELLRQSDLLDFDDLICLTHRLFRDPDALAFWREQYDYIIIDEMQDTSSLEYDTLRGLFPGRNVMMCGDPFQTIYEWRGSEPDSILPAFMKDFNAVAHAFAENYRSTRLLTSASFGYLKNTFPELMGRYCPDRIVTRSPLEGEKILNVRVFSPEAEARWIYDYLEKNAPEDPTRVCIMARANSYIARLYKWLSAVGQQKAGGRELRFFTVDNDSKLFRKAVIKDILAFFSVLLNSSDTVSLSRIVRNYTRGVGQQTIEKIAKAGECGLSLSSFIDPGTYLCGDPYQQLIEAAENGEIVIYDTETTGLDLSYDQIIQISAIRMDKNGRVTDTLDQMVIPTVAISAGAQATHHQTLEDIIARGGIDIRTALERFSAFCRGAVLVGHNSLRFDAPLIKRQLKECGLPLPGIVAEYDTMVIAKQLYPRLNNFKLATLCEKFGIVNEAAHDALGDIKATGAVLFEMLDRSLLPASYERREAVAEHLPKFAKFYAFLTGLREEYLAEGRILEMTERIVETCRLSKKYPEPSNQSAVADLLYAIRHSGIGDPESFLRGLLEDAALSGSQMDVLIRKLHKIPIITVHQSKGCEFDTVILASADDGTFPAYVAVKNGMLEEEKRVFYVAISRAKRKLIITSSKQKNYREVMQSRFIDKIPPQYMETVYPDAF